MNEITKLNYARKNEVNEIARKTAEQAIVDYPNYVYVTDDAADIEDAPEGYLFYAVIS